MNELPFLCFWVVKEPWAVRVGLIQSFCFDAHEELGAKAKGGRIDIFKGMEQKAKHAEALETRRK